MGRCTRLGSLRSFLSYASQLSGPSVLQFDFSHPQFCSLEGVVAAWRLLVHRCCFAPGALQAQKFTYGRLKSLMTVASLFIPMAGNTPFLTSKVMSRNEWNIRKVYLKKSSNWGTVDAELYELLYINSLANTPLSVIPLANISPHLVGCLFGFVSSFLCCVQKLFIRAKWNESHSVVSDSATPWTI